MSERTTQRREAMKEPGQIAYEIIRASGFMGVPWHRLMTWEREAFAAVESALHRAALEEAAKVAETVEAWKPFPGDFEGNCIAAAIRALGEKKDG